MLAPHLDLNVAVLALRAPHLLAACAAETARRPAGLQPRNACGRCVGVVWAGGPRARAAAQARRARAVWAHSVRPPCSQLMRQVRLGTCASVPARFSRGGARIQEEDKKKSKQWAWVLRRPPDTHLGTQGLLQDHSEPLPATGRRAARAPRGGAPSRNTSGCVKCGTSTSRLAPARARPPPWPPWPPWPPAAACVGRGGRMCKPGVSACTDGGAARHARAGASWPARAAARPTGVRGRPRGARRRGRRTVGAVLLHGLAAAGEREAVDLVLDLRGRVRDEDGAAGVAAAHLAGLALHGGARLTRRRMHELSGGCPVRPCSAPAAEQEPAGMPHPAPLETRASVGSGCRGCCRGARPL